MSVCASDVISLSPARADLSELADQVKAGAENIITKNSESYVAIIDATVTDRLTVKLTANFERNPEEI